MGTEDLERRRRSIALLTPGQPAGLSREEAMALLAELREAREELGRIVIGMRGLLAEVRNSEPVNRRTLVDTGSPRPIERA